MLDRLNNLILSAMDVALGWLLHLPATAAIFIVALGTALIMLLARKWTTDQNLLKRCRQDKKRLRQLIRQVKRRDDSEQVARFSKAIRRALSEAGFGLHDQDASRIEAMVRKMGKRTEISRYRKTLDAISLKSLRYEFKPLLAALLPVALLATWCFARLGYHPPKARENVEMTLYLPFSATGKLAYIVPVDGLESVGGWMKDMKGVSDTKPPHSYATWTLRGEARSEAYQIRIRCEGRTYERTLRVGQPTYSEPLVFYPEPSGSASEINMKPVKLFGVVPGIWVLAPWLVGYLLITGPAVPLLKRLLRIY